MSEETLQAETPVPAVPAESAPAAVETSVPKEETIPKGRFDEVYGKWRSTERDLEYWRELAVRNNKPEPVETKAPELPTPEQHGFDDAKYQAALTDYNRQVARSEAIAAIRAEREQERQQARVQTFKQREAEFQAKTPDYRDKVYGNIPISQAMAEIIAESPDGPAVAYELANNIELASQIYELSPVQAAREIGRIEARLAQAKVAPVAPKPVLTNAPPPPPTIEAVEPAVEKNWEDMSDTEFKKVRKRQIAQRR